MNAVCRVVQRHGIDRENLEAPDSGTPHRPDLSRQLSLCHRGSEPPPTHHDSRIIRGRKKVILHLPHGGEIAIATRL